MRCHDVFQEDIMPACTSMNKGDNLSDNDNDNLQNTAPHSIAYPHTHHETGINPIA
jgi:hypothetical protein